MRVIFSLEKQTGTNLIVYPDVDSLFTNATVNGSNIIANYSGALPLTEYIEPLPSFEDNQSQKLKDLNTWHDTQTALMKSAYSQSEIDSFLDKRNEALAYRADFNNPTPYVDAMVTSGGIRDDIARVILLDAILSKVDAVAQLETFVSVTRDAIKVCLTQADLDAITF